MLIVDAWVFEADSSLKVSRCGVAKGPTTRAQTKDNGPGDGARDVFVDHRYVQWHAPVTFGSGASPVDGTGHAVTVIDFAVAVGVNVKIGLPCPDLVKYDCHPN